MAPRIMPHGGGHGPGGYYRPGARYPGRWWRGGDGTLTWIESDVNLLTDGNPPQAHDDLPPPSTDDVPVTPAEPGDATTVVPGDTPGSVTVIRPPSDDDNASVSPSDAAIATQGAHMYREYRSNPSSNSLIACGALVAPFSEPIKVEFDIDGRGMLLAKLCVGDRCYQGSADISGLIREGIRGARELHDYLHATRSVPLMRRGDVPLMGGWADSITEPVKSVRKIAADAVWRQMDDDHNRTGQPFPFYVFVYWSPRAAGSGALDPGHYEALGFEAIELAKRFIESNLIDPNVSYIAAFELGASGPRMAADTSGSKPDGPKVISSGVAVSGEGNCGVHTYTGVTRPLLDRIFQRLSEKGATITGGNPYNVTGLEGGVELNGSWNPNGTLTIEVVNSNWYASCDRIWGEIDGDLRAIGAQLVVSGEAMIAATGELLVGKLLEQHRQELMAGWWDSVKDIGKGIGKGFMAIQHNTALVVQKFKGPITAAATAVATAYGGPAAGAAAAKFMGPLIDSQVAIGDHKKAAQKIIAAAEEVAKTDPRVRQALDLAHTAVTQAAAGYHIAHTAQQAANGDPAAQKAVAELAQAQASGNPQAKAAIDLANSITGVFGGGSGGDSGVDPNAIEMDQPDASSGDDAAMSGARSIREIASAVARETPGRIVGFVKPRDNAPQSRVFATTDQADDWYGGWLSQSPDAIEYIAYWDKGDPTFPGPLNETVGEGVRVSGGPLVPFLLGLAGGAGGYYGATKLYEKYKGATTKASGSPWSGGRFARPFEPMY